MPEVMDTTVLHKSRPPLWRSRFYVHPIQRTYAFWFATYLFVYSLLVFGLCLLLPSFIAGIKLVLPLSVEERALAARQFLTLAETMWPGLFALIVAASGVSIYITHRLAGPLYRIEESLREMGQGNLAVRVQLRKSDELQEVARLITEAAWVTDSALSQIQRLEQERRTRLDGLLRRLSGNPQLDNAAKAELRSLVHDSEQVQCILKQFRLSGNNL